MEFRIVIDNRIHVPLRGLGDGVAQELAAGFEHHNAKREDLRRMGLPHWGEPAIIRTWVNEADKGYVSLPRGGMQRVRDVLREHGHTWKVEDLRSDGNPELGEISEHKLELWPHQREALDAFIAKQQGIIRAPTGSGKTSLGFAVASRVGLPTLVVVDSKALMDQWVRRAVVELGMKVRDVGILRGSTRRVRSVTIGMAQTLAHCASDFAGDFGLVICDEVQGFSAPSFMAAVDPFKARYRLGISADHRRKDKKEFLIHDVFGDVVHDIDRKRLEDEGRVLDVEVRVVPTEFRADWYGMADGDDGEDERELDFDCLLKEMAADEERNRLGVELVMAEVQAGERVLAMAHQREHCQVLSRVFVLRRVKSGFLIGGPDFRSEFQRTAKGLLAGKMQVGVGTLKAIGKGIDLPAVGRAVVFTPVAGNRQFSGQVRGRICRAPPGKRDAVLYVLWDQHCSFGPRHLRNLVAWNRSVKVRQGDGWVDGREYLKRIGRAA